MPSLFDSKIGMVSIITWLRNTSTLFVSMEFGGYDITKDVWDMFASRYAGSDGARDHHLMVTLY